MQRKRRSHFNFEKNQNDSKSLLLHPQNRILEKVFNNRLGTKTTTGVTQSQQRVRSKAKYVFLQILYFSLRLCGFFCDNKLKNKNK